MKNWKTTLSGLASIVGGIATFVNHPDQAEIAIGMIITGLGLILAKDHNVSGSQKISEDIGLPKPKDPK